MSQDFNPSLHISKGLYILNSKATILQTFLKLNYLRITLDAQKNTIIP
jgi:hypothetical protein